VLIYWWGTRGSRFSFSCLAATLGYGSASELLRVRRSKTSAGSTDSPSSPMMTEAILTRLVSKLTVMHGAAPKVGQFLSIRDISNHLHPLIDFKHCSKITEQIGSVVQNSPARTRDTMRPDLLAYAEYSLKSCRGDDVLRLLPVSHEPPLTHTWQIHMYCRLNSSASSRRVQDSARYMLN
jgi:hypothetical protein